MNELSDQTAMENKPFTQGFLATRRLLSLDAKFSEILLMDAARVHQDIKTNDI